MIVRDPTELLDCPSAPGLEEQTGADVMISPLRMPVAPATLYHHVRAGALLVQIKRGLDLISSVGPRLQSSIAKMRATGARNWQCVLLYIGVFLPSPGDSQCLLAKPTIHDNHVSWEYLHHPNNRPYQALLSSLRHWTWYGGVVLNLPCDDLLPDWLRVTESRLMEKYFAVRRGATVKEVWPEGEAVVEWADNSDPFQTPVEVRDWRRILAAFPGVGPARATALRQKMLEEGAADTLLQALVWITDGLAEERVPGWGPSLTRKVREALGLQENEVILTDFIPEEQ